MSENCVIPKYFAKIQCTRTCLAMITLDCFSLNSHHFWHHTLQQILNARLQSHGTTWTATAASFHLNCNNAIYKTFEINGTAVHFYCRSHVIFKELTNLAFDFRFLLGGKLGLGRYDFFALFDPTP
jgi:hypothetical protein